MEVTAGSYQLQQSCLYILCMVVVASCPGCRPASSSTEARAPRPNLAATFIASGGSNACQNNCWLKIVPVIRGDLGLDPDALGRYDLGRAEELMESLRAESAAAGSTVRRADIADALEHLRSDEKIRIVLTDRNGHIYVLLGMIQEGNQVRYEFLHGDSQIKLLEPDQLVAAGFLGGVGN